MKKLHLNITNIHIKAKDPGVLSNLIADIDKQLRGLVDATDSARNLMTKYSSSNNGSQYENACTALHALSRHIKESVLIINDLEAQVVAFQNKVYRFEGINKSAPMPKKYVINESRVVANHAIVQYGMNEMRTVATGLSQYCDKTRNVIKGLLQARSRIATIWVDSQFKDFSAVIDSVRMAAEKHIKELDSYVTHLNTRIKELMN